MLLRTLSVSQNYTVKENHQIFKSFNPTGARFNDDGMGCQSVAGIAVTQCEIYPVPICTAATGREW